METILAPSTDRLVTQRWRVQAYDGKMRNWHFIGSDSATLRQAEWYRDNCLKPNQRRTKFRIIEESVIKKVVG